MTERYITERDEKLFAPVKNAPNLSVAFYDGFKPINEFKKEETPSLYICIKNSKDRTSVVKRKAGSYMVEGREVKEIDVYKSAYDKYIAAKTGEIVTQDSLIKKNKDLEAQLEKMKAELELQKSEPKKLVKKTEKVAKPVIKIEE